MLLFPHFINKYVRHYVNKKGEIKEVEETTNKVYYHVKKWFEGVLPDSIPPYFLRHNRWSKLSEKGVDLNTLRMLKGSKTYDSITPYLHLSSDLSKKAARHID